MKNTSNTPLIPLLALRVVQTSYVLAPLGPLLGHQLAYGLSGYRLAVAYLLRPPGVLGGSGQLYVYFHGERLGFRLIKARPGCR